MHDPAERSGLADSFADVVPYAKSESDSDELTDSDSLADHVAVVRSAERTVNQRRVGVRRWNALVPIVRPR